MAKRASIVAVTWLVLFLGVDSGRAETPGVAPPVPTNPEETEPARAEDKRQQSDPRKVVPEVLRIHLVISRSLNDKKVASLPYDLLVSTGAPGKPGPRVRMRMGIDTPVPTATRDEPEKQKGTEIGYRTVGTSIDCGATALGEGKYQLILSVESSSAVMASAATAVNGDLGNAPLFRRFEISVYPILRDGQTIQTIASTDPVTGEVLKIDLALSVVK